MNPFSVSCGGHDVHCPECGQDLEISSWSTEYGNPADGDYDVKCPNCSRTFELNVSTTVTYFAREK